ncbi:hypothetical protein [Bifidobacterium mongoliense]|nr:hypothetical protein [Bifidobacterium mongoliense]
MDSKTSWEGNWSNGSAVLEPACMTRYTQSVRRDLMDCAVASGT